MYRILPFLLLILLAGCKKNEMTLTFDLSPDVNSPCRIVYYASSRNEGMLRETVAQITQGKGELKLPQKNPSLLFLLATGQELPAAVLYGEAGNNFTVTGKNGDIREWSITGNEVTDSLSSWRIRNINLIKANDSKGINSAVADYVKKNPDSEAAAVLLYVYFCRRGNEKEFSDLLSLLNKKLLENEKLMAALSAADLMTGLPDSPSYPSKLILTGQDGYADTLNFGSDGTTLLLFRMASRGLTEVSADSLKALVNRKGSKKVAEIFMDTDSLNWKRHISDDSIAGMKRLWMPLGLADSVAMKMQVKRLPYYIIIDSQGKELYHGDDWKEAFLKFGSSN